jgi:hypothetical protein
VAGIFWILETIWDFVMAPAAGTKKPAGKSFIKKED